MPFIPIYRLENNKTQKIWVQIFLDLWSDMKKFAKNPQKGLICPKDTHKIESIVFSRWKYFFDIKKNSSCCGERRDLRGILTKPDDKDLLLKKEGTEIEFWFFLLCKDCISRRGSLAWLVCACLLKLSMMGCWILFGMIEDTGSHRFRVSVAP